MKKSTKRTIAVMLFLVVTGLSVFGQQPKRSAEVTDDEWQHLLVAVSNENWDMAVSLSSKYSGLLAPDDRRLKRLRYIYLYAAAGKVSEGRMSFDELEELTKQFIGKEVILPYRPLTNVCRGALNFICSSDGGKEKLSVAATNKTGTTIHAFEYVQLEEPFDISRHEGEEASIEGVFESIKPNPNKSTFLVMRIYISKGSIKLKEEEPRKTALLLPGGFAQRVTGRFEADH